MNISFTWQGKPITDIRAWAREHNEKLVHYRATRDFPSLITGKMEQQTMSGFMPESFWNSLRMADGWFYEETGERETV